MRKITSPDFRTAELRLNREQNYFLRELGLKETMKASNYDETTNLEFRLEDDML